MQHNPYAAPTAPVADSANAPTGLEDASRLRRFSNQVVDIIGYLVFSTLVGFALGLVYPAIAESSGTFADYVLGYAVLAVYYVGFEGLFGRTPGKLVTGTYVVTTDGGSPTFLQILGRTLARFIPFEPFSFFRSDGRGWHDDLSRTRVVRLRRSLAAQGRD